MGKPLLLVSSVTYAMKGKAVLSARGVRAYVERVPQTANTGCGYGVYVPRDADVAEQILRENGIKILDRLEQEEGL